MTAIQQIAKDAIKRYKNILVYHGILDDRAYHLILPDDLSAWYVYMEQYGHSILCILKQDEKIAFTSQDKLYFLIPMPVKTVLNNYRVRKGIIICTNPDVSYDGQIELPCPTAHIEF